MGRDPVDSMVEPDAVAKPIASAKVLISGAPGAGLSTFVETVSEITPILTDPSVPFNVDYGRVTVDKSLRLYLFGTPRQDRYGFVWNQLLIGALGAVVIVDSRKANVAFPAIDVLENRDLPFVVALNVFGGSKRPNVGKTRVALDLDPDVPVLVTDVRDPRAAKKCLVELLDAVLLHALAGD